MATTHSSRTIQDESDGVYVTFIIDCPYGLAADPVRDRPAESKWLSASVARALIAQGYAVESDPAPKQKPADLQSLVLEAADSNGQVKFRMKGTGQVFTMHWDVALQKIRQGVAELV